tara:strand:- start:16056 stop:16370 length:315 start_codon:yes stop_codon:yes gene_type:complete
MKVAGKTRGAGKPFVKGDPRINRQGRPRGSRDKMSEALVDAFYADWMENGDEAIRKVREDDISTYVRIAVAMMPKELKQEVEVRDTTNHASEIEWDVITGGKSG